MAVLLAETPIDLAALDKVPTVPHILVELNLAGMHTFLKFHDANASKPYAQTKDVARMLRMVKPHCVWGDKWARNPPPMPPMEKGEDEEEDEEEEEEELDFIDEVIRVFDAVPPGGRVFN